MDEADIMDEEIETGNNFPGNIILFLSNFRLSEEEEQENCETLDDFIDQNGKKVCDRTFTALADVANEQEEIIGEIRANMICPFQTSDGKVAKVVYDRYKTIYGEEREPLLVQLGGPERNVIDVVLGMLEEDIKWGDIYITMNTTQTIDDVTYYAGQDYKYSFDDYMNTLAYTMENVSERDQNRIFGFFHDSASFRKPYSLKDKSDKSDDFFNTILYILLAVVGLGIIAFIIVKVHKNYKIVTEPDYHQLGNPGKVKTKRSLKKRRRE
tara:strand:+ start:195 stop:998 length:804 start_codon:yes stop_codon:yes gene_type:complete